MKKLAPLFLLLLVSISLSAQTYSRFVLGIYTGWSFGTSQDFGERVASPHTDVRDTALAHLGIYVQSNIDRNLGLQLNANLQVFEHRYKGRYSSWMGSGTTRYEYIVSFVLKSVMQTKRLEDLKLYLSYGGGLCIGNWNEMPGTFFNLTIEPGLKLYIFQSKPNVPLILGLSFHHLREHLFTSSSYTDTSEYIRLNVGIEF